MAGGWTKKALWFEFVPRRTVGRLGQFALSSGGVGKSSRDYLARKNLPKGSDVYFIAENYGTHLTSRSNAGSQHSHDSTCASLRPMPLAQLGGSTGLGNKPFSAGRFAA